ncbi:WASH complex subunit 2A isoform X3 [Salmo trutta]|uniref:WASH complex subunit 2A isoform X3 n=1 Tax=Salmo trutta TaxID=8032 RepID=UPI0011312CC0|nr:WASH complex subunit 2A-like isoform X3 [Salmo trutta]
MSGLPDGMANVPSQSNHAGEDGQVWERAWTLEEMRQTSANWSLAADSGLFLFLQDFSQRMLSKTHEIEKQLDGLIRDTKATDCCLHTVFNDFLMLSNTQFIENRVYDEEVEEPVPKAETLERQPELVNNLPVPSREKTREQKEAELIPKVQEAVNFGLRVLDSAFEQLDIKAGNSDSEDEEATDRVEPILEPKDLYVDRPLPYLIGSQLFMEQDDVGLGDLSSEEISIDSDRDSVIDSEDGKDADQSDEDFDQDEEGPSSIKKKSSMLSDDDEGEESDIFGESDKDDDDEDCITNTGPSSFADELAARIKGEPISKPEGDRTSLSSASKKKSKTKKEPKPERPQAIEDDSEELFGPPKMEDEDFSPFGGKGGLFSGGRGLFDDDDEGDLFSDAPKQPVAEEKTRNTAHATEPVNSAKKIPSVAVSIFPENSLFGIPKNSDSVEGRENGSLAKPNKTQTSAPRNTSLGGGGGGLFDDDEEDDFFTGKSLKKSSSAGQKKSKQKKTVDLFGGDDEDEDGDIFSESSVAPPTLQSRKEVVVEEEEVKQAPQKKMPAGGVSMFGPGTKSLLTEALKKRQPSTSEESEENGPPPDVVKTPTKQTEKPQAKSLFSDDEDSQIFQTIPKSPSKPEPTTQSKAPLSIFDDEEEEDLFASAKKSKPSQANAATPKVKKPVSSSLFSDDEDQWMSSKPSAGKTEGKTGGMKSSTSAPSSLPSVKAVPKDSLFDEDDDDLFAATKESSQKKHQRVSLLFEDEDDEDKGSLFGFKTNVNNSSTTADPKAPVVASPAPSLLQIDKPEVTAPPPPLVVEKPTEEERVAKYKSPEVPSLSSPLEGRESKKKPVGAVSLFGGINVLGDRLGAAKQTKSPLDDPDGDDFLSEGPPPMEKEAKTKKNTLSLFDDVEEEGADWTAPISIPTKPVARNTLKPAEERPRTKSSTGVFQDEELLFSQTQQRDNDPDVDIFATPDKSLSSRPSSVKSAAPTLFGDDEDDLFSSVKPKAAPPVSEKPSKPTKDEPSSKPAVTAPVTESEKPTPSPVKSKEPSRIGKLQANLVINPAALLPDAFSRIPGGVSVLPGLSPSPSSSGPSASLSTAGTKPHSNKGVSFENPVQVSTLQSANKGRAKGSIRRRPQTRAARQTSAQRSVEQRDENHGEDQAGPSPTLPSPALSNPTQPSPGLPNLTLPRSSLPNQAPTSALPSSLPASLPSKPLLTDFSVRPSVLTLPVSNTPLNKDSSKGSKVKVLPSLDEDDLFGSDSLFGSAPAPGLNPTIPSPILTTPSPNPTTKTTGGKVTSKNESEKEKETTPQSLFDDPMGDLFKKVKPRSAKKAKASSFLEDEEEGEEDIFGLGKSSTPTTAGGKDSKAGSNSTPKQNIFQDEAATPPKKHKEKSLDASLFDDNVDIFADMTSTSKPKEKKSKKVETKSIFDDDMDDIFSPSTVKPVPKQPPSKSKKNPPSQDTSAADDSGNIFDDPLNALGGN